MSTSTILILGARSDMARGIAQIHAKRGDLLLLAGRNQTELNKDAEDLRIRYGNEVRVHLFDALDTDSHITFSESLPQIDRVYCAFGYLGDQESAQVDHKEMLRIVRTNYDGAVSVLDPLASRMEKAGKGNIVGISSVAGERGRASNYFYGSAKAGFTAYLSGLRNRLAKKGVHVLTVKPGFVATAMTEGLDLPPLLTASAEKAAKDIVRAADKQKNVIYTKWMWRYVMLIIRNIPEMVFKKLSL
ncbi:MAG: SDR family oxidoreductase [Bacteroidota bacterium]